MKLINQLDYRALSYPTTLSPEADLCPPYPSVAQAGCGICCACMMVEYLTGKELTVEEGIAQAVQAGANRNGTDMKKLGGALATCYHLHFSWTDEIAALSRCLNAGGAAILNVGGSTQERTGTFSQNGHFIFAFGRAENRFCIADPSYTAEKYQHPDRIGRVVCTEDQIVEVSEDVLAQDLALRSPSIFLFQTEEP